MPAPSLSYRRFAANVVAGAGGRLAAILVALALTTVLVRTLGAARYGTWSFFFVLIGFHAQIDLGLSVALERGVARAAAEGRAARVPALVASALGLAAGLSILLQAAAATVPDRWLAALGETEVVRACLRVLPICLFCSNAAAVTGAALAGLQRTSTLAVQRTVIGAAAAVAVAVLAAIGVQRLHVLLLVYAAGLVTAAAASWRAVRPAIGGTAVPWPPDGAATGELLAIGGPLQATTLMAQLGDQGLRLLIGSRFGAAAMGAYDLAFRAANAPRSLVASLLVPLVPFAAGREHLHGQAALTHSLWLSTKYATGLVATATIAGVAVAGPLMAVWLAPGSAVAGVAAALFTVLLIALAIQTMAGPMVALGRAGGRPGPEAVITAIAQPLAVGLAATQPSIVSAVAVFAAVATASVWILWWWLQRRLAIDRPARGWLTRLAATVGGVALVGWMASFAFAGARPWLALAGAPALVAAAAVTLAILTGTIPAAERQVLRDLAARRPAAGA